MITMEDVAVNADSKDRLDKLAIAFSIDNEVVHTMATFEWFYDLISAGYGVVEAPSDPGEFVLYFMNNGEIKETFKCSQLLSALLRSDPKIHVIVREPKPTLEELGILRYVDVGWAVTEAGEFVPPAGWHNPQHHVHNFTEEQIEALKKMGHNI